MSYAELYCQSNFSFLQAASHPEELILQASQLGYSALALTDECSVAGVVRAYRVIKEQQLTIKLIVGASFVLDDGLKLILLAPNRQGYAELCRVITNARRRCAKGHYQFTYWDLHSIKHCFILWLPSGDKQKDQQAITSLLRYHQPRLSLAYSRFLHANDLSFKHHCQQLAKQYQLSIVACGGVLMHQAQRQKLQHVLSAIKHGKTLNTMGLLLEQNAEKCLRPVPKLVKLYPDDYIIAAIELANQCHFCLSQLQYEYPAELVPKGQTAITYLKALVLKGIALRFPDGVSNDIQAIIDKELLLIEAQGYEYFFLTIYDIVQYAKSQHILYQGRGSAANSIVCYCLEITSVDPRQISVLFERFISKERNEPPDIDVDFEHQRREEIFQYIYQKYGREHAALAATVITYRLKSAIRDVGKVFGFTDSQLSFFIKNINRRQKAISWQAQVFELGLNKNSHLAKLFIELVQQIIGFPRHLSQHVGGFVISSGPLYELVPVENAAMAARTVIQWDKNDLATLGLLKVDVLALGMLTAIRRTFSYIKQHYQVSLSIADITRLPDDPQVYAMLQQADTVGVFQIESRAQMSMLPRLKPKCYYDLVVQIAIVRPGPIQGDMVHPYLRRRAGLEAVEYPSEAIKGVLSRTLGVPIFQEQVIKIAMVAAGFSGGEADQLRRAMAKWQRHGELTQFREKLIVGMSKRGYQQDFAERIYQQICGFGEYGFPESHSASFAVLAYVSAWLKYYYPAAFYTGLLNSYPMGFYSRSQLIQDAQRHGISVRALDINRSALEHQLSYQQSSNDYEIQLGLSMVKGLSAKGAEQLISHRPALGYQDFASLNKAALNQKDIEKLASANALSSLADNRYLARWQLMDSENSLPLWQTAQHNTSALAAQSAFDFSPSVMDDLLEDYASTGVSLDKHPIALLLADTQHQQLIADCTLASDLVNVTAGRVVSVLGVVTGRQSPGTASGVTFVTLEDHTGNSNVVIWQATANAQKQAFLTAKILKVTGIIERADDVIHIIAGRLLDLSDCIYGLKIQSRDFH
ncbi:DNA polymerase III, alpha subunit [Colwellia chukchiensis]|uniref:Error-prone DNA polymerase n=1 Tax=Colwellia chukchiensis TaxID=641665 RepID=A0A1H7MJ14_9GAMM|nr:error-prone DNA polymerase [Colwellia chukchiensis]SEL11144.1 DNA polymerase III, alpha subunit [Colwellia chukchiensis]